MRAALFFFSRMVGLSPALSSLLVSEKYLQEQVFREISPVTVFALVRPPLQLVTASLITLFRPWAVGLALRTSRTFALLPSPWLHSLLISLLARLAHDPGLASRPPIAVRPKITLKSSWWSLFILLCLFALDSPGFHADRSSSVSLGRSCFVLASLVMPGYSSFQQAGSARPLSGSVPTAGGSFMLPLHSKELLRTLPLVPPCPPAFVSGLLRLLS